MKNPENFSHADKVLWMHRWCDSQNLNLDLRTVVGRSQEAVGITYNGEVFPEYADPEETNPTEVWVAPDAFSEHPYVAVLGRGEEAERQLFEWLFWFHSNNFICTAEELTPKEARENCLLSILLCHNLRVRMVRKNERSKKERPESPIGNSTITA